MLRRGQCRVQLLQQFIRTQPRQEPLRAVNPADLAIAVDDHGGRRRGVGSFWRRPGVNHFHGIGEAALRVGNHQQVGIIFLCEQRRFLIVQRDRDEFGISFRELRVTGFELT